MDASPDVPNPLLVFGLVTAYQRTEVLRAAIDLDLFTAIGEGATTVAALARRCRAAERGVRILADALVTLGLLTKAADDAYGLTATAAMFLDRRSPTAFGGAMHFLGAPMLQRAFSLLTESVRRGGTAVDEQGTTAPDHPIWVDFARDMAPIAASTAALVANLLDAERGGEWRILDIAAGHGQFGVTLAVRNPRAHVVALDWTNVLAVARETAKAAGVADRFSTIAGSAFDVDYHGPYDLILLPNFLHHFDEPTCVRLLRKVHAALAPGGRALTVEFVPDADRVNPPDAAFFAVVMLATTPAGDAYTFPELDRMFSAAGFSRNELHELPPSPQRVVISYR